MDERTLKFLQSHRPALSVAWESRLRASPVISPLANPDALIHLMGWTLGQLFRELDQPASRRKTALPPPCPCPCGRNPLIAYFATLKTSLHETLHICSDGGRINQADADDMEQALEIVARHEIATFCALCVHNGRSARHKHDDPKPS